MTLAALSTAAQSTAAGVCDVPGGHYLPGCIGRTLVEGAVGGAASAALRELGQAVVSAAQQVAAAVVAFLAAGSNPDLSQGWFTASFDRVLAACGGFAALFFLLGIGRAILASSTAELARVVGFTVLTFAGSAVAVALVQGFVLFVDAATAQVAAGTGTDIASTFSQLMSPLGAMVGPEAAAGQVLLGAGFAALTGLGMLAVYLELFVRNVMIHVVVFFLPLMLAGTIWAPTRRWARRGLEFLAVLIVAKFVLFAVLALGWSGITSLGSAQLATSWASVLTGVVLVVVAAWLPWLLFKLLPFMEVHTSRALTRRDAGAALAAPASAAAAPLRTIEANLRRAGTLAALT